MLSQDFVTPSPWKEKKLPFLKIGTKSKKSPRQGNCSKLTPPVRPLPPFLTPTNFILWKRNTKRIYSNCTCFECHTGYLTKKIAHFNILFFSCNIIINIKHESKRQSLKNDYYLRFVDKSYTFFLFVFHMGTLTWKLLCSLCAERRGWRGRKTHRLSSFFHLSHY